MTHSGSPPSRVIALFSAVLLGPIFGGIVAGGRGESTARADTTDETVEKITQLNKEAITDYQAKKYDDARRILKQALDMAAAAGLDNHPIAARTHIHLGVVIINGFKQRDLGIKQFKKALEIQPEINLTKVLVTPDLQEAFAEAKSGAGDKTADRAAEKPADKKTPPPETETPPEAPTPAATVADSGSGGLVHDAVNEGKQGSAISITVGVPSELQFDKLVLAYRPDGATDFLGREMKQVANGRYGAEIPPSATSGGAVAYYIEADDKDGGALATRGSVDSPLVIHLVGVGAARSHTSEEEEDDESPDHRFFLGLMAGSGVGWATGQGDTNADTTISPAGLASAGVLEVSPEAGYWMSSSLMLSLQMRYEHITGTTDIVDANNKTFHTANYALAVFAKATWKYGEGKFHPFFSLAAGGGRIRHVVSFKNQHLTNCGPMHNQDCVDTIGAGPVLLGPGAGFLYDLGEQLALVLQLNSVVGFPNFTVNLDGNIGVAFGF
jgi:hypothetical protein